MPTRLWIPIYGTCEAGKYGPKWSFAEVEPQLSFEEAVDFINGTKPVNDFASNEPTLYGHRFIGMQCPTRFMPPDEYEEQRNAMEIARQIEREEDARQRSRAAAGGW